MIKNGKINVKQVKVIYKIKLAISLKFYSLIPLFNIIIGSNILGPYEINWFMRIYFGSIKLLILLNIQLFVLKMLQNIQNINIINDIPIKSRKFYKFIIKNNEDMPYS